MTPAVCGSIGPLLGGVRPRCGRSLHHIGPHSGHPGSGFERESWTGWVERDERWAEEHARQQTVSDLPGLTEFVTDVIETHVVIAEIGCEADRSHDYHHQADEILKALRERGVLIEGV